jgi:hypothetical protein
MFFILSFEHMECFLNCRFQTQVAAVHRVWDIEGHHGLEHHHSAAQPLGSAGQLSWREGSLLYPQSDLLRVESLKYQILWLIN